METTPYAPHRLAPGYPAPPPTTVGVSAPVAGAARSCRSVADVASRRRTCAPALRTRTSGRRARVGHYAPAESRPPESYAPPSRRQRPSPTRRRRAATRRGSRPTRTRGPAPVYAPPTPRAGRRVRARAAHRWWPPGASVTEATRRRCPAAAGPSTHLPAAPPSRRFPHPSRPCPRPRAYGRRPAPVGCAAAPVLRRPRRRAARRTRPSPTRHRSPGVDETPALPTGARAAPSRVRRRSSGTIGHEPRVGRQSTEQRIREEDFSLVEALSIDARPWCVRPPPHRGRAPTIRVSGSLVPLEDFDVLTPPVLQRVIYAILTQAQRAEVRGAPRARLRLLAARPGAVPRQRLPPARLDRCGVPHHPVRDQDAREPGHPAVGRRTSPTCRAASSSSRVRPARASRRRWPRSSTWPTARGTTTS